MVGGENFGVFFGIFAKIITSFLDFLFLQPRLPLSGSHIIITMAAKSAKGKKSFSAEVKAEAVQLLAEGATVSQVAGLMGCSINSIQNWKKAAGVSPKRGKKKKEGEECHRGNNA